MSKVTNFVIFAAGVAVGSLVTWHTAKKKYEEAIQEEVDSVKEAFAKKNSNADTKTVNTPSAKMEKFYTKPDIFEYAGKMKDNKEECTIVKNRPYVISPEEFGEFDDYDKISLSYYADQVLADENDEAIEDVDDVVGTESLTHFGEYEDDSVFVRNDKLKCDYEILMDQRAYSDVIRKRPHRTEE